jgi:hypothetical protein
MTTKLNYEIDLYPFGKHWIVVEVAFEAGEPEYNGDNGSAPAGDNDYDLISITKDGIDVYDMISDGFCDEYKKLCAWIEEKL